PGSVGRRLQRRELSRRVPIDSTWLAGRGQSAWTEASAISHGSCIAARDEDQHSGCVEYVYFGLEKFLLYAGDWPCGVNLCCNRTKRHGFPHLGKFCGDLRTLPFPCLGLVRPCSPGRSTPSETFPERQVKQWSSL